MTDYDEATTYSKSDPVAVVQAVFLEVLEEMDRNPGFADRVGHALRGLGAEVQRRRTPARRGRRAPGVLDPFAILASGGQEELRRQLGALDIDRLRDIVAEHGMDTSKLAMRWKSSERLLDFIVSTVSDRAVKGHAFRSSATKQTDPEPPLSSSSDEEGRTRTPPAS